MSDAIRPLLGNPRRISFLSATFFSTFLSDTVTGDVQRGARDGELHGDAKRRRRVRKWGESRERSDRGEGALLEEEVRDGHGGGEVKRGRLSLSTARGL